MMEEKKITNLNFSLVTLIGVDYKFGVVQKDKTYSINVSDSIQIKEVKKESFKIIFTRSTKNHDPFYVSVSYEVVAFFDEVGIEFYAGDIEKIYKFAETNKIDICNKLYLPSKASLLISNIIRDAGSPLVTPPIVTLN